VTVVPGLPGISWHSKPKVEKYTKPATKCTKMPLNTPNGLKKVQITTKLTKIFQSKGLKRGQYLNY
jgi:hypothetical protein